MQHNYFKAIYSTMALIAFAILSFPGNAQIIEQELKSFDKIIISPHFNVNLVEGTSEGIHLNTNGLPKDLVNIKVVGKTLKLYLEDAKISDRKYNVIKENGWKRKVSIYEGVEIDATITYKKLKHLQVRGTQTVNCDGLLDAPKFRLKLYGETRLKLASLKTDQLKASLFGENKMVIKQGNISRQIVRLFGENSFNTRRVKSKTTKANSFGDSKIYLNTSDWLKVNAFGESAIYFAGNATLYKGIVLGENEFGRIK